LPFLQRVLGPDVPVLPVAVGQSTVDDALITIAAAVEPDPTGTVVLCSTDLSHYQPDAAARRQDRHTIEAVVARAPERIGLRDACGVYALRGLVGWARHTGRTARVLALATSADTGGDPDRVVGYPAVMMSP
jgi:MEMO1 family protein